jgi:hypothetical protein
VNLVSLEQSRFVTSTATAVLAAGSLFLVSVASAQTNDGLRCGSTLVSRGDTKGEVRMRCGPPVYQDSRVEFRPTGNGGTASVTVDEWTYDLGAGSFLRTCRFENGVLQSAGHAELLTAERAGVTARLVSCGKLRTQASLYRVSLR